jgi:hypothetical protein
VHVAAALLAEDLLGEHALQRAELDVQFHGGRAPAAASSSSMKRITRAFPVAG